MLIPTVGDRTHLLAQVLDAVHTQLPAAEVLTVTGVSWGAGLNMLMERATGEYISCCCDDTVPVAGWFAAGKRMLDEGAMPASRYFDVNGFPLQEIDDAPHGLEVGWCRSFLLTPALYEQVGPFIDATWYADFDYSERLTSAGIPIFACDGYTFTHLDGPRDWLTPQEDSRQKQLYEAAQQARQEAAAGRSS